MKNLIKQTLDNRFNLDNFISFTSNLFNEIDINPQEINIPGGSQDHIKKFIFLGEFYDVQKKGIDILAVELATDSKVERARALQRNLIARFLKDNTKDAGLVAFYSRDNPDWRLSFVKMDYKLTDKGIKVEIGTPPKRYSFLVGETEPSHTAQNQLLPILKEHKNNPLASEIEEAFSVEKVTKEFYEQYRGLFDNLSKNLKENKSFQIIAGKENIDIDNFAKKLLGQIVFLYFLQKKGWLGVARDKTWGQGDKLFLRTLFDKAKTEKKNFYNNYLEPLFYDTLNNPRRDEVDPAYSRYFDCKIPFLNGGLFEADYDWKHTIVHLRNDLFEEIIDTFDLYNFTVKEDEPLEKEVAVDPEMLGKVFENLLPENLRKGRGAYYTPREIVHYMCQESLINYLTTETGIDTEKIRKLVAYKDSTITKEDYYESLENPDAKHKIADKILVLWEGEAGLIDKALSDIKVCDPACGSGAFLVGMLNEIVSAKRILTSFLKLSNSRLKERSEHRLKKETIQNCIYGVDIDPGAVEIAKLRLWLSLVVDYELSQIKPLPNLDYKIMCGNSLLEELVIGDESIRLFDERLLNIKKNKGKQNALFGDEFLESNNFPHKNASSRNEYLQKLLRDRQKQLLELHSQNKLTQGRKRKLEQEINAINKELNPRAKKSKTDTSQLTLFAEKAEAYLKLLKGLHKEYFTEYDPVKKKEKREQIEDIELEFIKTSIKEKVDNIDTQVKNLNMQNPAHRKKLPELTRKKLQYLSIPNEIHRSKVRPYFLWKLNFFEVFQEKGGFDVVIANPPYVRADKPAIAEQRKKILASNNYKTLWEKWDLYVVFIERAFQILSLEGVLEFIIPDAYMASKYARKSHEYFLDNAVVNRINFCSEVKIFDAAVKNIIIEFKRDTNTDNIPKRIKHKETFDNFEILKSGKQKELGTDVFKVDSQAQKKLKFTDCLMWGEICYVSVGLVLNAEENIAKGEFKKEDLISDREDAIHSKRYAEAKWIKKYRVNETKYLEWDTARVPHKIRRPTFPELYVPEKIMMGGMTGAIVDNTGLLCNHSITVSVLWKDLKSVHNRSILGSIKKDFKIKGKVDTFRKELEGNSTHFNLKYLLSILNSGFGSYYLHTIRRSQIGFYPDDLKKLPIKKISLSKQKPFIDIVDKILAITKDNDYLTTPIKHGKVKEYERRIDQMVYKLYGLTNEEMKVVEKL